MTVCDLLQKAANAIKAVVALIHLNVLFHSTSRPLPSTPQMKQGSGRSGSGSPESQQELSKVKSELDKKVLFYEEELVRREASHTREQTSLWKELHDTDVQQRCFNKVRFILKGRLGMKESERPPKIGKANLG